MAAHAGWLGVVLVLGALAAAPGARAQITCNVPANWTETAPLIGFLGVGGACPGAETAVSVDTCGQCVCSAGSLFQTAVNTTQFISNLNSSDIGGFALFSDFLTLCINNQASSFTEVSATEAGIQACLADTAFQTAAGGSVTGLSAYCSSLLSSSPPSDGGAIPPSPYGGPSVYGSPPGVYPSPPVPDAIPPEESSAESSGEESSGAEGPSPPPFPPGTILPPPYPPGFVFPPPGVYPPPRPPSAATLPRASLFLQAAIAALALLCSVLLL